MASTNTTTSQQQQQHQQQPSSSDNNNDGGGGGSSILLFAAHTGSDHQSQSVIRLQDQYHSQLEAERMEMIERQRPSSPQLLRTWNRSGRDNHGDGDRRQQQQQQGEQHHHHHDDDDSTLLLQSPPVAPAVVMEDNLEDSRTSLSYGYPVARFVMEKVRTSIDHISQQVTTIQSMDRSGNSPPSNQQQQRQQQDGEEEETVPLSIRSEAELPSHVHPHPPTQDFISLRPADLAAVSHRHYPEDNNEYIIVDGELIAVNTHHDNNTTTANNNTNDRALAAQEQIQDMLRQQLLQESVNAIPKNCQPKRMRRGMRRLAKLFTRKGKNKQKQQQETTPRSTEGAVEVHLVQARTQQSNDTQNEIIIFHPQQRQQQQQQQQPSQQPPPPQQTQQQIETQIQQIYALSQQSSEQQQSDTVRVELCCATDGPSTMDRSQRRQLASAAADVAKKRKPKDSSPSKQKDRKNRWKDKKEKSNSQKEKLTNSSEQSNSNNLSSSRREERKSRSFWGSRKQTNDRKKPPPSSSQQEEKQPEMYDSGSARFSLNGNDGDAFFDNQDLLFSANTGLLPPTTDSMDTTTATNNNNNTYMSLDGSTAATNNNTYLPMNMYNGSAAQGPMRDPLSSLHATNGIPQRPDFASLSERTESVTASYVGTADMLEVNVLGPDTSIAAESFIESGADDDYDDAARKKEDECSENYANALQSVVPRDADFKVDKADAPDVEAMLRRAVIETTTDLEAPPDHTIDVMAFSAGATAATASSTASGSLKSDCASVPLSEATVYDEFVHNDILKVVVVSAPTVDKTWLARALRQSKNPPRKRTTLAVDVHEWSPSAKIVQKAALAARSGGEHANHQDDDDPPLAVKCKVWDVQGATAFSQDDTRSNFGVHPGTQSLFFSAQSLYLLVYDLACNNPKTYRRQAKQVGNDDSDSEDSDFDDDEDYEDDFVREEANRQADRALHADIANRVLSWVDCIANKGPMSAILPVALIPDEMSKEEIKRRCDMMQNLLEEHVRKSINSMEQPKLLTGTDNILCVNYRNGEYSKAPAKGIEQLQETIVAIATDSSHSVFSHVGTPVPSGTTLVRDAVERFKQEHKMILLDHLLGELGSLIEYDVIIDALHFLSSIGEILYFGAANDDVLSHFIILDRKWLVSAISCILRNDLKRELVETRRFMNMQCIYSDTKYGENDIIKALVSGTASNIPLLSNEDAKMLWQSMTFMREASDRHSQFEESSTAAPTMFYFLERLLVHSGVLLPLETPIHHVAASPLDVAERVFFVPSLLAQTNPSETWTFKSNQSFKTTLCHSWLFRDGAPLHLMERIVVKLLCDIYDFSREFSKGKPNPEKMQHAKTAPLGNRAMDNFIQEYDSQILGRVRIHQLMCWKSSLLVKIGTIFADKESGRLVESFVEVFVAVVNQSSSHCVASDVMRPSMQRVVVSGKGQDERHGRKLWKGGYKVVLDSVRSSLSDYSNVDEQVICPECLAQSSPRIASTWSWDSVLAVAESGSSMIRCLRGHRVDSNLICGTLVDQKPAPAVDPSSMINPAKPVSEILPSVVILGVWNPEAKSLASVGSGFVVDKKHGLIVTAAHVLFKMDSGHHFGLPYLGIRNARVVIGVLSEDGHNAVFRYFGEIVADDVHNVDACIVRIRSRMENDVDDEGTGCADQKEVSLNSETMSDEQLKSLKLIKNFELEENVRVLGYNQGGEGILEKGKHVNRAVDFAKGYICRVFKAALDEDSSSSDSSDSEHIHLCLKPREEIVVMCPTIAGHSGGPCVNNEGRVIGILSRADRDCQRCYLVPATEIKTLVNKAKAVCSRPNRIAAMKSM